MKNVTTEAPKLDDCLKWYSVNTYCGNCNKHDYAYVRKGVKKKGLSVVCNTCGCKVNL